MSLSAPPSRPAARRVVQQVAWLGRRLVAPKRKVVGATEQVEQVVGGTEQVVGVVDLLDKPADPLVEPTDALVDLADPPRCACPQFEVAGKKRSAVPSRPDRRPKAGADAGACSEHNGAVVRAKGQHHLFGVSSQPTLFAEAQRLLASLPPERSQAGSSLLLPR